ncbi:MAG TPA: hypothetical protein VLW85_03685 [Myxococcales bacterium]|nr:hypothetical protein [Myxococcales bacterium]
MAHRFKFYRVGGLDQVALETGADLAALEELDQKLWVALSCPVQGLEIDSGTLQLLDTDNDGRVRAGEILGAIRWCKARLRKLDALIPSADGLKLADIDDSNPAGKALLGACRQILAHKGKPQADSLGVADVADVSRVFDGTRFNGDGVITPASADDGETRKAIEDAIACGGGTPDRSGAPGIDKARLDAFYGELQAFADWSRSGVAAPDGYEALQAVRVKVDDWFNRCRIAEFDPQALVPPQQPPADLAALPLARIEAGAVLPLLEKVNPAWSGALQTLQQTAVAALFGPQKTHLTHIEWQQMQPRFAAYEAWLSTKKGATVEKLGAARVQELLQGPVRARIEALIAQDLAVQPEADAIADAVRMARYRRDLHTLLMNFVNFADFYADDRQAVFQSGTLYLDSRSCDLCVRVADPGAHAALASLSRMYIAYCECKRPGESMKIAACFTQGDSDYLMAGRNGVFYDRQGRDWDATIVRVVDNPISIRQAFFAPYKKFIRLIEEQAQKFAESKQKEEDAALAAAAQGNVAPPAKGPVDVGKMVGIIAALGVGVGAIGTIFGGFVSGFMNLQPWWAKLVGIAGAMMAISGPSMALAWLKLRQRTLGPMLEANGWAVNSRVKVGIPLGTALTAIKALPPGSSRSLDDPFEDKRARRRRRITYAVLILVAIALGVARWQHVWPFAK